MLKIKEETGIKIYWDGACTKDKIQTFAPKGVDGFVLGTNLLFGKKEPYSTLIKRIRNMEF